MKAEELMIGDWVQDMSGAKMKIVNIEYHCTRVLFNGVELILACFEQANLMPIPITPEILERIGFKKDSLWHHCDKDLDDYSISVQLGYANRIEYIKIVEKGKDNVIPSERTKLYLTHIKYVHLLQHALRLCGIEKTIEL